MSRALLARGLLTVVIIALLVPPAAAYLTYDPGEADLQRGTVSRAANGSTVVSVQGFHFRGYGSEKKPARLVSVDERGHLEWVYNGSRHGDRWFYDVDPLPDGRLLVVSTRPGRTNISVFDSGTGERQRVDVLPLNDTHDVAWLSEDEYVVANMRHWDDETETNRDRVIVYDRRTQTITWEWLFKDHYPASMDGGHATDWTHVNDVDVIDEHRLLVSPRNFDQVIVLNRTSGAIELQLGEDDRHDVLHEPHNPDYLVATDGTPTILVADSENDRVVEYALTGSCDPPARDPPGNSIACDWELVWELGGVGLNWPRDADRLPNGNTLVTDTLNHRVIEVTPTGEIVWEYYATWGPYDAERVRHGQGSNGPTMRDLGVAGAYELSGSAGLRPGTGDRTSFGAWLTAEFADTPLEPQATWLGRRWAHVTPWIRPVWWTGWDLLSVMTAVGLAVGWGLGEAVVHRSRIRRFVARRLGRSP